MPKAHPSTTPPTPKPSYGRGMIIYIDLGMPPDAVKGHEQAKNRPCMVVKHFEKLQLVTVLPISGNAPSSSMYTVVKILAGEGSLSKDSFVLCHQLRTISTERIDGIVGTFSTVTVGKVISVLLDTLELWGFSLNRERVHGGFFSSIVRKSGCHRKSFKQEVRIKSRAIDIKSKPDDVNSSVVDAKSKPDDVNRLVVMPSSCIYA